MQLIWILSGFGALTLGIAGAVLPGLPTTPFVLLASACFARGSTRWHRWLREHRRFGRLVREWEDYGAIGRRAKIASVIMLAVVGTVSMLVTPDWRLRVAMLAALVGVAAFLVTRPLPPRQKGDRPGGGAAAPKSD